MDGLHQTARAHYDTFTEEQRRAANDIFADFDKNGDRKLSISEFEQVVGTYDYLKIKFQDLDTNGDGNLDFEEFKTVLLLIGKNQLPCPPAPASPRTEKQRGRKRKKIKAALKTLVGIFTLGTAVADVALDCTDSS